MGKQGCGGSAAAVCFEPVRKLQIGAHSNQGFPVSANCRRVEARLL